MFKQRLFAVVSDFIFSRWARGYEEHHGQCENAYAAWLGPLHLEVNHCFVVDHDDAYISARLPLPMRYAGGGGWGWGRLHVGYVVCLGEDEIRPPGWFARRERPYCRHCPPTPPTLTSEEDFPF